MLSEALLNLFGINTVQKFVSAAVVLGLFTYLISVAAIWIAKAWFPNINGRLFPTISAVVAAIFATLAVFSGSAESFMVAVVLWALILVVSHGLRVLWAGVKSVKNRT